MGRALDSDKIDKECWRARKEVVVVVVVVVMVVGAPMAIASSHMAIAQCCDFLQYQYCRS